MLEFGKKFLGYCTIVPTGTVYDITAADADIEDMETELDAATEIAFGCGRTIPLIGMVEVACDLGDANPCMAKERNYKVTFTAGGIEDDTAGTLTTLIKGLDGTIKDVYVYDKKTEANLTQAAKIPCNPVWKCVGFLCKVRMAVTSLGKPTYTVECVSQYDGSVSTKLLQLKDAP